MNPDTIPHLLIELDHWINWRYCPDPKNPDKHIKRPVSARSGRVCNAHAPSNWTTFLTALAAHRAGQTSGLGFVLTDADPFVGVDLDSSIDAGGNVSPWALAIVERLNSYTEITPSGRGLRVFVRAHLPPHGRRRGNVEIYESGRYLTVTGDHLAGTPATIEERAAEVVALHREIFGEADEPKPAAARPAQPLTVDDDKLLGIAFRSAKGPAIRALWDGHIPQVNGNPDHSAADQALVNHLVYWTQGDLARADRLFRQSALYRPKWDEQRGKLTYGERTLNTALETIPYFYDPSYRGNGTNGNGTNGNGYHAQAAEAEEIHTSPADIPTPREDATEPHTDILRAAVLEALAEVRGLETLVDGLAGIDGDEAAVKLYALDNVDRLARLDRTEQSTFYTHLQERGVTGEWLRLDLKPAVKEAGRQIPSTGEGSVAGFATWIDYVNAAADLGYAFRLNDMNDGLEVNGARMTDAVEAVILSKLHAKGLKSADVAKRAFLAAAVAGRYHPVKDYLDGLTWDGNDHAGALAIHFQDAHAPITYGDGTQRSVFHAFLLRWLIGAVAKVYDSSRAQNPMLILDGAQGKGKSYFAKWICPLPELHFEGAIKPEDKDYLGYLTTRWIWEVSELDATMRKADREALKAFVTLQDATFRPAYGRHPLVKPALASFIGTVNLDGALLSDPTGHRRFWPVTLETIHWGYSQAVDLHQLWAQASALYQAGEP